MRLITVGLLSLTISTLCSAAEDIVFKETKQVVQDGDKSKEQDVALVFTGSHTIIVRHRKKTDEVYAEIPYDAIKKVTYEQSTHPHTKTAIFVSPLALLAKSKKHWLTIEYKKSEEDDFVLLHLDKSEYQRVIATVEAKTGKEVERITES